MRSHNFVVQFQTHRNAVGRFNIEHKILNERDFVQRENYLQSGCRHLAQNQQIEWNCVNLRKQRYFKGLNLQFMERISYGNYLKMSPFVILDNSLTISAWVFRMQRVQWILCYFEFFDLFLLLHHCHKQPTHQFDTTLFQFIRLGTVLVLIGNFLICHRQTPYREYTIHIVTNLMHIGKNKNKNDEIDYETVFFFSIRPLRLRLRSIALTQACGLFGLAGNRPVTGCWCAIINRWTIRWYWSKRTPELLRLRIIMPSLYFCTATQYERWIGKR